MLTSKLKNNRYIIVFFLAVLLFLIYISLFRSGDMGDEGLILADTQRIMAGQIIYRDFFSLITPGIYYLLLVAWSVFGQYYLIVRLLIILIAWLICVFIYLTSRVILSRLWSALQVIIFIVLLYPNQLIISFHWLALLFILVAGWQINHYLKQEKDHHLVLSGLSLGLGAFFLHVQPIIAAAAIAIFLLWYNQKKYTWIISIKKCLIFSLSFFGSFTLLMLPFLLIAGPRAIWEDLIISNAYYYPQIGYISLLNNVLLFAVFVSYLILFFILYYKKLFSEQIVFYFSFSLIMILSSLYRLDQNHLAYIYPCFTLSLLFYAISKLNIEAGKNYKIFLAVFLICPLYVYYPFPVNQYINYKLWQPLDTNIGQVYFYQSAARSLRESVLKVLNNIPDKEIFIYPYSVYYYSFANKVNPTRYNIIYGEYLSEQAKEEIKNDLAQKQVKYILYAPAEAGPEKVGQKFLADWLKENYNEEKIEYDDYNAYFYLYTKK